MASSTKNELKENKKSGAKIACFILLLVIIGATTGCLFSPYFNITDIIANDYENVASGEIIEVANIPIGINIFRINDSKIENQIESLSYVKKADVYRAFPSTIILKIEERKPYAIVKYLESFAVADKYGYILEIKKENDLPNLPIIYGLDSADFKVGQKLIDTSMLKYENSVYLLETAEETNFNYNFTEINYDDSTNVKLYIKEKEIDIIYGAITIDNIEEKLSHLASILQNLQGKEGKIDMSNEDYLARTVFTEKK